jgi:hypothetical protein
MDPGSASAVDDDDDDDEAPAPPAPPAPPGMPSCDASACATTRSRTPTGTP